MLAVGEPRQAIVGGPMFEGILQGAFLADVMRDHGEAADVPSGCTVGQQRDFKMHGGAVSSVRREVTSPLELGFETPLDFVALWSGEKCLDRTETLHLGWRDQVVDVPSCWRTELVRTVR